MWYYILNEQLTSTGIGIEGDLWLGGDGLANGYWKRDDLNQSAFKQISITPGTVEKLYYSGDRARWLNNGNLEFLGRKDRQVKIRGYRVELAEIEHCITLNERVADCRVIYSSGNDEEKILTAYLIFNDTQNEDLEALKSEIQRQLPAYMHPNFWHVLQSFPLTRNGKVDLKQLAATVNNL